MATETEKKEFALSQLAPYLADPSTCGCDEETTNCQYLTKDNKMCVAGKNMIEPKLDLFKGIDDILEDNEFEQEGVFKPEVVGIMTNQEWKYMQTIHDAIATQPEDVVKLKVRINSLNLFTYEELVERANNLK
jgi:hypothetical protein